MQSLYMQYTIESCVYDILYKEYKKHRAENYNSENLKSYFEEMMALNRHLQQIETNILRILDQICAMNKALLKYQLS